MGFHGWSGLGTERLTLGPSSQHLNNWVSYLRGEQLRPSSSLGGLFFEVTMNEFNKFLEWTTQPKTPFYSRKCHECSSCFSFSKSPLYMGSQIIGDYKIDFWGCLEAKELKTIYAIYGSGNNSKYFCIHHAYKNFEELHESPTGEIQNLSGVNLQIYNKLQELLKGYPHHYVRPF